MNFIDTIRNYNLWCLLLLSMMYFFLMWGRVRRYCERGKDEMFNDEMFNAKMDLDRGWILGMFLGMTRSVQLLEVRILNNIDIGFITLRSHFVKITKECRVDGADDDMSAILTQIIVSKQQFILITFRRCATELREEQCGKFDGKDDREEAEFSTNVRCKGWGGV